MPGLFSGFWKRRRVTVQRCKSPSWGTCGLAPLREQAAAVEIQTVWLSSGRSDPGHGPYYRLDPQAVNGKTVTETFFLTGRSLAKKAQR